jgi:hypothetical protein
MRSSNPGIANSSWVVASLSALAAKSISPFCASPREFLTAERQSWRSSPDQVPIVLRWARRVRAVVMRGFVVRVWMRARASARLVLGRASIAWRSCSFRGMGCLGPPGGDCMILAHGARFDRGAGGGFVGRGAIDSNLIDFLCIRLS